MRSWLLEDEHDMRIEKPTLEIVHEDIDVLETLRPIQTPPTNTKELMTPSDKVILMYREKLREWDASGWQIDYETLVRDSRKVAYAIPCPARRTEKGWVLDTVPVAPAREDDGGADIEAFG